MLSYYHVRPYAHLLNKKAHHDGELELARNCTGVSSSKGTANCAISLIYIVPNLSELCQPSAFLPLLTLPLLLENPARYANSHDAYAE